MRKSEGERGERERGALRYGEIIREVRLCRVKKKTG